MVRTTTKVAAEIIRLDERMKEIELQNMMKSLILYELRSLYGLECATGSTFDIITTRTKRQWDGTMRDCITVQAIAYLEPNSSTGWKLLKKGSKAIPGHVAALQEFLMELERDAAKLIGEAPMLNMKKKLEDLDDMFERLMNG